MTASTEQERAEFQRLMDLADNFGLVCAEMGDVAHARKKLRVALAEALSARRAQVVLNGWKLVPDEVPDEMVDAAIEAYMPFGDMRWAIEIALAAAPQPPEAACNPSMQPKLATKAAPVQIQEFHKVLELAADALKVLTYKGDYRSSDRRNHKLATIANLRQLLAQHGIK